MALFGFTSPAHWVTSQRGFSVCAVCHAWPAEPICSPCVERFAQPLARCPMCALPGHTTTCPECLHSPPPWERSLCAVPYGYPWDTCLARLKFDGDSAMGRSLAHVMQHAPGIEPALEVAQWVVPMPPALFQNAQGQQQREPVGRRYRKATAGSRGCRG